MLVISHKILTLYQTIALASTPKLGWPISANGLGSPRMSDPSFFSSSESYRQLDKLRNAEAAQLQDELNFTQEFRKLITGGEVRY